MDFGGHGGGLPGRRYLLRTSFTFGGDDESAADAAADVLFRSTPCSCFCSSFRGTFKAVGRLPDRLCLPFLVVTTTMFCLLLLMTGELVVVYAYVADVVVMGGVLVGGCCCCE